jgi:hypothetical protein
MPTIKPKIFLGSSTEKLDIAYAIQENLQRDAEVAVWTQGVFDLGADVLDEILDKLNDSDFGVFVFSPDDRITIRTEDLAAVRDNVLFEYGLFVGRLGRARSVYVKPKDAANMWIPSDLAGVVSAGYDSHADNLVVSLGPACNAIRRKIKELGIRENRFRILSPQDAKDNRCGAVTGTWKGTIVQRQGNVGIGGPGSVTFNFTPTKEGLVGDGFFDVPNYPRFHVKLHGTFLFGDFVKIEFRNVDERALHFACVILELSRSMNAKGRNELKGQYVGHGGFSGAIVSGEMTIEPAANEPGQ